MIHGVFGAKESSRTSLYLEDILDLLNLPGCDYVVWGCLYWTGFCLGFPKIYDTWVIWCKIFTRTSLYLEDILDLLYLPGGDNDAWDCLYWTGFCLRFFKIYDTWGHWWKVFIKNLPVLGGLPWSSWPSWGWSWWFGSSPLKWILPQDSENVWYMGYLVQNRHQVGNGLSWAKVVTYPHSQPAT